MNVLVAIDSFKGSLSSQKAASAVRQGILDAVPSAEVSCIPIADGGEGTTDVLLPALGGMYIEKTVTGPLGAPIQARYGFVPQKKLAVIEAASAAGITLVPKEQRNPLHTTTYGFGELIADAIDRGCERIILGLGGSATNDCGIGMLQALGYQFYDAQGEPVGQYGKDVKNISSIDDSCTHSGLKKCRFEVASDVKNPLCGPLGASVIYGPQKGASPAVVQEMDKAFVRFAQIVSDRAGFDYQDAPGAGAAGGLGFALKSFLNANIQSGITLIMDTLAFGDHVKNADIVFTGEGKLDGQTSMGKVPAGIAQYAKQYNKLVIALAGCVTAEAVTCNASGIDAYFPIVAAPCTEKTAMDQATAVENLRRTASQIMRLVTATQKRGCDVRV